MIVLMKSQYFFKPVILIGAWELFSLLVSVLFIRQPFQRSIPHHHSFLFVCILINKENDIIFTRLLWMHSATEIRYTIRDLTLRFVVFPPSLQQLYSILAVSNRKIKPPAVITNLTLIGSWAKITATGTNCPLVNFHSSTSLPKISGNWINS